MKKFFPILLLFLLLTAAARAEDAYRVIFTVMPFTSKVSGPREPSIFYEEMLPGSRKQLDLEVFTETVTMEAAGQKMAFVFDHELELIAEGVTAPVSRIVLESGRTASLRTPTMDAGARLQIFWFSDEPDRNAPEPDPVYRDFIRSMSGILRGEPNGRYGAYEDYSVMFHVRSDPAGEPALGWTVMDIDGDGRDELLFGEMQPDMTGTVLYDLYTITDGELVHVFDGWNRSRYYLTEDGGFLWEGSGSAACYFRAHYRYTGNTLQLTRALIHDAEKDPAHPWFLSDTDPMDADSGQPVSEAEARQILSGFTARTLELQPFED